LPRKVELELFKKQKEKEKDDEEEEEEEDDDDNDDQQDYVRVCFGSEEDKTGEYISDEDVSVVYVDVEQKDDESCNDYYQMEIEEIFFPF
ncbi:MAG: hypothetical protein EZS28_053648, partial [Streblomastix strix]